jgi:hypothetical protein
VRRDPDTRVWLFIVVVLVVLVVLAAAASWYIDSVSSSGGSGEGLGVRSATRLDFGKENYGAGRFGESGI